MAKSKTYNPTNPLGNTTVPAPVKPVVDDETTKEELPIEKKDTLQPVKVDCGTLIKNTDSLTTKLWDSLMKLPEMQTMQDTAINGIGEMALSAYDSSGYIKVFKLASWDSTTGFNSTAPLLTADTSSIGDRKNVVLMAHTHNKDIDPYPEPHDLYTLLHRRLACNAYYCYPKEFNHSFFLCGDTAINLALEISDTSTAMFFINKYKRNKAVIIDTLPDGTLNPRWSDTYTGEYQTSIADSIPLGVDFEEAVEYLRSKNYPEKLLKTYAQVVMLKERNIGVVTKMLVDGKFKELSVDVIRKLNGKFQSIQIKICD